jgi:L-asparaginase II
MLEFDLAGAASGTDGCGIPTYAVPLRSLAQAMAKFATPETLPRQRAEACRRITQAVIANSWMIGGTGRFDTDAITAGAGNLVVKMGAEGVHVAIVRNAGLGMALKIDDGGRRAADCVMAAILRAHGYLVANSEALLAAGTIRNNRGETVGEIRTPFIGGPKSTLSECTIRDIKHET